MNLTDSETETYFFDQSQFKPFKIKLVQTGLK